MNASVLRKFLIQIIRILHTGLIIFILFGWLLPFSEMLLFHIIFVPLVLLSWQFNNGTCFLTNVENYLSMSGVPEELQRGEFSRKLIKSITGKNPADETLRIIVWSLPVTAWVFSTIHYYFWYR